MSDQRDYDDEALARLLEDDGTLDVPFGPPSSKPKPKPKPKFYLVTHDVSARVRAIGNANAAGLFMLLSEMHISPSRDGDPRKPGNNGRIALSREGAGLKLKIQRVTAAKAFEDLKTAGVIKEMRRCTGRLGEAMSEWRICHLPLCRNWKP